MRLCRLTFALPVCLMLAGCDLPTGPRVVAFERLAPPAGAFTPQVFGGDGQIMIQALFRTPCEEYDATAAAEVSDGVLRLLVRGDATGPCSLDIVGTFYYRATVARVSPGRYVLRAVHTYADANWPVDSLEFGALNLP